VTTAGDVVVIGIGNILQRDDGVGVHVARELAAAAERDGPGLPPDVRVVDGGTIGLGLLPLFDGARAAILIDAVELGHAPGSVVVMGEHDIRRTCAALPSAHEVGLADLLDIGRLAGLLPPSVTVIGVQPGVIATGLALTVEVAAAVERAASLVRQIAARTRSANDTMWVCTSMPSPSSKTSATDSAPMRPSAT
jgi:hydrogenase maturation protease